MALLTNLHPSDGSLVFRAEQGASYRFGVAVLPEMNQRTIRATIGAGHPHDVFSTPAVLSGRFLAWTNTVRGAMSEPGEERLNVGPFTASIWAEWVAPESGLFRIALPAAASHLQASVFRGESLSSLERVSSPLGVVEQFPAEAGSNYFIRIASMGIANLFTMRLGPAEPNDTSASATQLSGTNLVAHGWNWTPSGSTLSTARRVWWQWTAPGDGRLTFSRGTHRADLVIYHTRTPTIHPVVYADPLWGLPPPPTNTIIVTRDVTYLFELSSSSPATNLQLNLAFQPVPVLTGPYPDALRGGDGFWESPPIPLFGAIDGIQMIHDGDNPAPWIEMQFQGPGTLMFRSKLVGWSGRISIGFFSRGRPVMQDLRDIQDWTTRSIELPSGSSAVRWTYSGNGAAFVDSLRFIPSAPPPPRLAISVNAPNALRLDVPLPAGRSLFIDYSTNLADWFVWTNLHSTTSSIQSLILTPSPETPVQFFRSRQTE